MIAMSGKSYSDGDFVKHCLAKTADIVSPQNVKLFKNISLTMNSVAGQNGEMANDTKQQLKATSSKYEHFAVATDDTVDITEIAIF